MNCLYSVKNLSAANSIFAAGVDGIVQFIVALFMLVLVAVMCYYTTKFIANYQKGVTSKGNIEVLEAKSVGANKLIEIVRIGNEYYALGIGKEEITFISKVDENSLVHEKQEATKVSDSFSQILDKLKGNKKPKDNK